MSTIIAIDFDLTLSPFSFPQTTDLDAHFNSQTLLKDSNEKVKEDIQIEIMKSYNNNATYEKVKEYMNDHVRLFLGNLTRPGFENTELIILTANLATNVHHILKHFIDTETAFATYDQRRTPTIMTKWKVISVTDLETTKVDWVLNHTKLDSSISIIFVDDSPKEQQAMQYAIDYDKTKDGKDSQLLRGRVISIPRPPLINKELELPRQDGMFGMFGERDWLYGISMRIKDQQWTKVKYWIEFLKSMMQDINLENNPETNNPDTTKAVFKTLTRN